MQLLRFIFIFFFFPIVSAQNYSFLTYSNTQGLPQSQVTDIIQDTEGYLWIGTLGGLAKFNGIDFEEYSVKNGMLNNRISCLNLINNQLWIGHEGGISLNVKDKFKTWGIPVALMKSNVTAICEFQSKIWISTNGSGLFYIENNKLKAYPLSNDDALRIRDLCVFDNKLLLATRAGLLKINPVFGLEKNIELPNISLSCMAIHDKQLNISSYSDGVYKLSNNSFTQIIHGSDEYKIKHLSINGKGEITIATEIGAIIYKNNRETIIYNQKNGLPNNVISCSFTDSKGGLWLGTEGKGLLKFTGNSFVTYTKEHGLSSDLIISALEVSPQLIWYGTYDQGAFLMDKTGTIIKKILPDNTIWSIYKEADKTIWFATATGLKRLSVSGEITEFDAEDGIPGEKTTCFYSGGQNKFWVGGSEGISYYKNGIFHKIKCPVEVQTVRQIKFYQNQLLVASDGGLFVLIGNKLVKHPLSLDKAIFNILIQDDKIWLGTEEGLFCLRNNKKTLFNLGNEASAGFINFLQTGPNGIYVGTNNGLYSIEEDEQKQTIIQRFGNFQGLTTLESNLNSSLIDSKNNLWFGSANGLIKFSQHTNRVNNSDIPRILFKDLFINYIKCDYAKLDSIKKTNYLQLPYSKNTLSLYFDALFLNDPMSVQLRYKLNGYTDDWSDWQTSKNIVFTKLPFGEYTLEVQAKSDFSNSFSTWKLNIKIETPFYYSFWFIALLVITTIFIVYLLVRSKLQRERLKDKQLMAETQSRLVQLEQQSLNASMNRHFIFNALNSIQYFINVQDKKSANKYLSSFAKLIRKNLDSSNEKNSMVTLEEEMERLALYMSLESLRFSGKFTYIVESHDIDLEEIKVPAMLLQPFVENSILHGILPQPETQGIIKISIAEVGEKIVITLTDNGIGIDDSRKSKNEFKGDHISQGMEITAKRIDLISQSVNAAYKLHGPSQIMNKDGSSGGTIVTVELPKHTD